MSKERPILMSGPMVKAILDGKKTMTRRIVKPQPTFHERSGLAWKGGAYGIQLDGKPFLTEFVKDCPHGSIGDRLWVREAFGYGSKTVMSLPTMHYRADMEGAHVEKGFWKPSIHMKRKDCRITLEITGVRVERLQDISEADAIAEGIEYRRLEIYQGVKAYHAPDGWSARTAVEALRHAWDQINGKTHPWESNCYVWVIEFRRAA